MKIQLVLLAVVTSLHGVFCLKRCSLVDGTPDPTYNLIKPCSRSKMTLVGSANTKTLQQCQRYAASKRALALNYNPSGDFQDEASCLLFDCPEFREEISLTEDDVYDYYSLYADPMPDSNVSCVPKVGMFKLHREKANFTAAQEVCVEEGGYLANVLSEQKTNALSDLIGLVFAGRAKHAVYVGLHDSEMEGQYVNMRDEPLDCFNWRAWAPNQPRSKYSSEDCVVLKTDRNWKVVNCTQEMPFLCELHPRGPYNLCEEEPAYCELTNGSAAIPSGSVDTSSSQPDEHVGTDFPDIVEIPLPGVSDVNSTDAEIQIIDINNVSNIASTKKPDREPDGKPPGDKKPVEGSGKPDSEDQGGSFKPGDNKPSYQIPWRPSLGTDTNNSENVDSNGWTPNNTVDDINKPGDVWKPIGNSNKTNKRPISQSSWSPVNTSSSLGNKTVLWRPKNPEIKDPVPNSDQGLWTPHNINWNFPDEQGPQEEYDVNNWPPHSRPQTFGHYFEGGDNLERPHTSTNTQEENSWRPAYSNNDDSEKGNNWRPPNRENNYNANQNYWTPPAGNGDMSNKNKQIWKPQNPKENYQNGDNWSPNNGNLHKCNEWVPGDGNQSPDNNDQWNPIDNGDQYNEDCNQHEWVPHDVDVNSGEEGNNNPNIESRNNETEEETRTSGAKKLADGFVMEEESKKSYRKAKAPTNIETDNKLEESNGNRTEDHESSNKNRTKVEEKVPIPVVVVKVRDPNTRKCRAVSYDPN